MWAFPLEMLKSANDSSARSPNKFFIGIKLSMKLLIGWLADWLAAWLIGWLIGWLPDWQRGWVADRLIGWWAAGVSNSVGRSIATNHWKILAEMLRMSGRGVWIGCGCLQLAGYGWLAGWCGRIWNGQNQARMDLTKKWWFVMTLWKKSYRFWRAS